MNDHFDSRLAKRLGIFAAAAPLVAAVIGLSVLTGWTIYVVSLLKWGGVSTWSKGGLLIRRSPGASLLRKAVLAAPLVLNLIGFSISKSLLVVSHLTWVEVSVFAALCSATLVRFIVVAERTAALAHSEGRLAGIIQSAMDSIITVDDQQHIVLFNSAAEKMFRCVASEAMGQPITHFLPKRFHAGHIHKFGETGVTNRAMGPENVLWAQRADGQEFQIEASISHVVTGGKKLFTVILREVTERVQAEQAVRDAQARIAGIVAERKQSEAELARQAVELVRSRQELETQKLMLQSVLDIMIEGLVAADQQGKFIIWNPAAERIMGRGMSEEGGEDWAKYYGVYLSDMVTQPTPEERPTLRAIRGEVSTSELYIRNPDCPDGAWIEVSGSPIIDKHGVIRGGVASIREITQRKKDELEIRKLNEELEQKVVQRRAQLEGANHELEAFTYSVSHDLRAPIRHIASFSKILSEDFGPAMEPEALRLLQRIESGTHRMMLLVDGLLSLSQLGSQSLNLSLADLNAIVNGVISALQPECDGRDVEWRIARLPALRCDPILMGQVFQKLLSNALKYSSRRTKALIEIDSIQQPGLLPVIFVRDNGAGFDMQYADKLFGVFQRMHTESEFEGTGVGLATVHRIIQKHGGRIWAEAEVDRGATFYFTLAADATTGAIERTIVNGILEPEHERRG